MQFKTACDYRQIFSNRVLYITGVGRSGTTILGKVLSSMRPSYYLFEPALLRWVIGKDWDEETLQMFRGVLFEDYFLNQIHGRINPNSKDWTYGGNQFTKKELVFRWHNLRRRKDAMEFIKEEKPWWMIKHPEALPALDNIKKLFPNCTIINIVRNGLDVVQSAVNRGWYTDEWCNNDIIDWTVDKSVCIVEEDETRIGLIRVSMPWYASAPGKSHWADYTPITRAACMWRCLLDANLRIPLAHFRNASTGVANHEIKYEEFCEDPQVYVDFFAEQLGLRPTKITENHIRSIRKPEYKKADIDINDIQEPERSKFKATLTKLGYEV